MWKMLLFKNKE